MRETFPRNERGDRLSARHINKINDIARRSSSHYLGSHHYGHSGVVAGAAVPPYFSKNLFEIHSVVDSQRQLYKVRPRFYDHDLSIWWTNTEAGPFLLDASDVGSQTYDIGNILPAYWNGQRSAYIPMGVKGSTGGQTTGDEIWCAQLCECAFHRFSESNLGIDPVEPEVEIELPYRCCVYRGEVRRLELSPSGDFCNPVRTQIPAWIQMDCDHARTLPIEGAPKPSGWVRLLQKDVTLTWRPNTDANADVVNEEEYPTITETLDMYEWCCWTEVEGPISIEGGCSAYGTTISIPANVPIADGLFSFGLWGTPIPLVSRILTPQFDVFNRYDGTAFLFHNVELENGQDIDSATITVTTYLENAGIAYDPVLGIGVPPEHRTDDNRIIYSGPASVRIFGSKHDYGIPPFSDLNQALFTLPLEETNASVVWNIPTFDVHGEDIETVDIAEIIEEIISQPHWEYGDSLYLFFEQSSEWQLGLTPFVGWNERFIANSCGQLNIEQ